MRILKTSSALRRVALPRAGRNSGTALVGFWINNNRSQTASPVANTHAADEPHRSMLAA